MEIKGTNYAKRKKDVLVISIGDEDNEVELSVLPPTKAIMDGMIEVAGAVESAAKGTLDYEAFDLGKTLFLVAEAMSHNTGMRSVTAEDLEAMGFDLSDVADFLGTYMFFLSKLAEGKN